MRPILVACAAIALAGCGAAVGSSPGADSTTIPSPNPTATPRPTPLPTPTPEAQKDLVLVEQGFTPGTDGSGTDWAQVGLVFHNPNSTTIARFVRIQLTFYDANNGLAGSSEETVGPILPGQDGAFGQPIFDVRNATEMDVSFRVDWQPSDIAGFGGLTFEQVSTEPEQFGGFQTRGFVVSSFQAEQENVQVVAIYKDAGGKVLGGEFTYVDFVPAMGRSPFEISTFSQFEVSIAATEMYASPGF